MSGATGQLLSVQLRIKENSFHEAEGASYGVGINR